MSDLDSLIHVINVALGENFTFSLHEKKKFVSKKAQKRKKLKKKQKIQTSTETKDKAQNIEIEKDKNTSLVPVDSDGIQTQFTKEFLACKKILMEMQNEIISVFQRAQKDWENQGKQFPIPPQIVKQMSDLLTNCFPKLKQFVESTFPAYRDKMTEPEQGFIQQDVELKQKFFIRLETQLKNLPSDTLPKEDTKQLQTNDIKRIEQKDYSKEKKIFEKELEQTQEVLMEPQRIYNMYDKEGVGIFHKMKQKFGDVWEDNIFNLGKIALPNVLKISLIPSTLVSSGIELLAKSNPITAFFYENPNLFGGLKIQLSHKEQRKSKSRDKNIEDKISTKYQNVQIEEARKCVKQVRLIIEKLKDLKTKKGLLFNIPEINELIDLSNKMNKCIFAKTLEVDGVKFSKYLTQLYIKIDKKVINAGYKNPIQKLLNSNTQATEKLSKEQVKQRYAQLNTVEKEDKMQWLSKYLTNPLNALLPKIDDAETKNLIKTTYSDLGKNINSDSWEDNAATLYITVRDYIDESNKPLEYLKLPKIVSDNEE